MTIPEDGNPVHPCQAREKERRIKGADDTSSDDQAAFPAPQVEKPTS
jgi:hypothetical protein